VNYGRPFEPPTRPAFIPLPPGAVEPAGWLRDWCITARDGYTGHMDEFNQAFRQAWASDYKMTGDRLYWPNGGWPYEGGGYWFDGLVRLGYILHDDSLINQAKSRLDVVVTNMNANGILFMWWLNMNNPGDAKSAEIDFEWSSQTRGPSSRRDVCSSRPSGCVRCRRRFGLRVVLFASPRVNSFPYQSQKPKKIAVISSGRRAARHRSFLLPHRLSD